MNIVEIQNTIEELEQGNTTYENCIKLSALYVIMDRYNKGVEAVNEEVVKEYQDILPEYEHYCDVKRQYQLGQIDEQRMIQSFGIVCKEITEFIQTLYSNSESPAERKLLVDTIINVVNLFG